MQRCWLKGALGDALHVLSCAAGYNIRWLLRAIAGNGCQGREGVFVGLVGMVVEARLAAGGAFRAFRAFAGAAGWLMQTGRALIGSRLAQLAPLGSIRAG